jgi:hypothetical protein
MDMKSMIVNVGKILNFGKRLKSMVLTVNETSYIFCEKHEKWKEEGDEMTCCDQEIEGELIHADNSL